MLQIHYVTNSLQNFQFCLRSKIGQFHFHDVEKQDPVLHHVCQIDYLKIFHYFGRAVSPFLLEM